MSVPYLDQMNMVYDGNDWHASLRDLLASVTAEQAVWRPQEGGHSIRELLRHLTYSAEEVTSRFRGGQPGWDEARSWPTLPELNGPEEWKAEVARYEEVRRALAESIAALTSEQLDAEREGGRPPFRSMAQQIIHHEAFHAGQIALLRRLQQQKALM